MAEEEVSYASVVFKNRNKPQAKEKEEETVYSEVKVNNKTDQQTFNAKDAERRIQHYHLLASCFGILCLVLVLSIIGLCIYIASFHKHDLSELNQLNEKKTSLQKENQNLTNINDGLRSNNENLKIQVVNLTKAATVLDENIKNLTAKSQNLTSLNEKLQRQNQELQDERKNLTEQIQTIKTIQNELNVSRAQWSIDTYCPKKDGGRTCAACQDGWLKEQSSCYVYNNAEKADQRTWEGARDDCKEKASDLTVVTDGKEKTYVNSISAAGNDNKRYWIGLRAEGGNWKWLDGTNLTNQTWIQQPATDGQCVISVQNQGWRSVSCIDTNAWICEKKALSV